MDRFEACSFSVFDVISGTGVLHYYKVNKMLDNAH